MGPVVVVFDEPFLGDRSDLVEVVEDVHIENGFAVCAIKSFDNAILHWAAGLDEFELDGAAKIGFGAGANGGRPFFTIRLLFESGIEIM